jgi:hypothetical protein
MASITYDYQTPAGREARYRIADENIRANKGQYIDYLSQAMHAYETALDESGKIGAIHQIVVIRGLVDEYERKHPALPMTETEKFYAACKKKVEEDGAIQEKAPSRWRYALPVAAVATTAIATIAGIPYGVGVASLWGGYYLSGTCKKTAIAAREALPPGKPIVSAPKEAPPVSVSRPVLEAPLRAVPVAVSLPPPRVDLAARKSVVLSSPLPPPAGVKSEVSIEPSHVDLAQISSAVRSAVAPVITHMDSAPVLTSSAHAVVSSDAHRSAEIIPSREPVHMDSAPVLTSAACAVISSAALHPEIMPSRESAHVDSAPVLTSSVATVISSAALPPPIIAPKQPALVHVESPVLATSGAMSSSAVASLPPIATVSIPASLVSGVSLPAVLSSSAVVLSQGSAAKKAEPRAPLSRPVHYEKVEEDDQLILGETSQYSYGEEGRNACAAIATLAAYRMATTEIHDRLTLDQTIYDGVQMYLAIGRNMVESGLREEGDVGELAIDECLMCSHFQAMVNVETERGMLKGHNVRLSAFDPTVQPSQEAKDRASYQELLAPLMAAAHHDGRPLAAIVTIGHETFALKYDPRNRSWQYFNSHGNDEFGDGAICRTFINTDLLVAVLAERRYYVAGAENGCSLFIVRPK